MFVVQILLASLILPEQLFSQTNRQVVTKSKDANIEGQSIRLFIDKAKKANLYFAQSVYDSTIKYGLEARRIFDDKGLVRSNDTTIRNNISRMMQDIGYAHLYLGNPDAAYRAGREKLELDSIMKNSSGYMQAHVLLGSTFCGRGDYPAGIKHYLQALTIAEKNGDIESIAQVCNNLGEVYNEKGQSDDALKYFSKSLAICEKIGQSYGKSICLMNIAGIYVEKKDYMQALKYTREAIPIFSSESYKRDLANLYTNLGTIFQASGEIDSALYYKKLGLKKSIEIDDKDAIANSYKAVGFTLIKMRKYKEAVSNFTSGLELSLANKLKIISRECYRGLTIAYTKDKDFEKALESQNLHFAYRDSISNEENDKRILEMQLKFDFEKKESELIVEQEKKNVLSEQEIYRQKIIRNITFVIAAVVLIALYLVYRSLNATRKAKALVVEQKNEINEQKLQIEEKQKEILDSINYARRIQMTLVPSEKMVGKLIDQVQKK